MSDSHENRQQTINPNGGTLSGKGNSTSKPWEVWRDYATTDEDRLARFGTMREAMHWIESDGKYYAHRDRLDVIKRLPDGTLTTEY